MSNVDFLAPFDQALARALPGFERIDAIARLSGGASQETWSFDALIHGKHEPLILLQPRRRRARYRGIGIPDPLETEAIVIEAARMTGVAAPRVRYVLKDGDNVGHGYVMDRLPGETIARKILRDTEFDAILRLAHQCGAILAKIYQVDTAGHPKVLPFIDGPAQLRRYRDLYDFDNYPHPVFEMAFKWLEPRMAQAKRQRWCMATSARQYANLT